MTADGRFGRLFDTGDDTALAQAVVGLNDEGQETLSSDVKNHFQVQLSFQALGGQLERYYQVALA